MSSDEPSDSSDRSSGGTDDSVDGIDGPPDDPDRSGADTANAPPNHVHCISCGESISVDAEVCPHCGVSQRRLPQSGGPGRTADEKYCTTCGAVINRDAELCPECGTRQTIGASNEVDRVAAGLIAIFLGGLGIHKFYLGDNTMGVLYLCFSWTFIPAVLGLIEGIIYLTKSDAEFQRRYVKR